MSVYDIAWHEVALANSKDTLERSKIKLVRLQEMVTRHEREVEFYEMQIAEAKRRGKDKFDPERFLKPSNK